VSSRNIHYHHPSTFLDTKLTPLKLKDILLHHAQGPSRASTPVPAPSSGSKMIHTRQQDDGALRVGTGPRVDVLAWLSRATLDVIGLAGTFFFLSLPLSSPLLLLPLIPFLPLVHIHSPSLCFPRHSRLLDLDSFRRFRDSLPHPTYFVSFRLWCIIPLSFGNGISNLFIVSVCTSSLLGLVCFLPFHSLYLAFLAIDCLD
jgi:hypothetical protein